MADHEEGSVVGKRLGVTATCSIMAWFLGTDGKEAVDFARCSLMVPACLFWCWAEARLDVVKGGMGVAFRTAGACLAFRPGPGSITFSTDAAVFLVPRGTVLDMVPGVIVA